MRLALDWGQARIGVAACDPDGLLAHPVETIPANQHALDRVRALADEYEPVEVVLGWPRNLRGVEGPAVERMRLVLADLERVLDPIPVVLVDERMSTADAARRLAAAGRNSRQRRGVIDQAAAVGILEQALESRRHR
ncbi:Holliday junction resolvase RuvX [Aestuariimicrobium ganziense]|uniref:Holliday junction resolvase RuvX n=1 Tax=Aestuariimicrobium ganziense TaxID=2773677 RepID=UPI0019438C02|nr:Holliday junction resolvase RuvX [Aestuariimicrobium ganziense]